MIHVVIGTRAQLIKMVPIMRAFVDHEIEYNFVFLSQHVATVKEILDQFGLKQPDYVVAHRSNDVVTALQMIAWSLRALLEGFRRRGLIFRGDKSGCVLVHGDAPPVLLGALLAKAQGLQVAQIEAGLRSHDFFRPFPEEITRYAVGRAGLIDLHFCQDQRALETAQHYPGTAFHTHGNTIVDTVELAFKESSKIDEEPGFALVSLHRFELLRSRARLQWVSELLGELAERKRIIFILHPPTESALKRYKLFEKLEAHGNLTLSPRKPFIEFQQLLAAADFVISDGGSNQEECAFLGIPCLILRECSEREDGFGENIVLSKFCRAEIDSFVENPERYRTPRQEDRLSPTKIILRELEKRGLVDP
ncbi:MAG: UDP-N-acetylglucosamine 2-epimerase [Pseudomonadota bacterium]